MPLRGGVDEEMHPPLSALRPPPHALRSPPSAPRPPLSALRPTLLVLLTLLLLAACGGDPAAEAYERGQQAFSRGAYAEALAHFEEAVKAGPDRPQGYLGRGMVRWQANQPALAIPDLDTALALQPDLTWAYFFRGSSYIMLHEYERGIADFDRVTASGELPAEDLLRAHRWRGIGLLNLERYEDALVDFTRSVELEPNNPFHYIERGRVYEALGRSEAAISDYRQFLILSEDSTSLTAEVEDRLDRLGTGEHRRNVE